MKKLIIVMMLLMASNVRAEIIPANVEADFLRIVTEQTNKTMPRTIDRETRADSVQAEPNLHLHYYFTITALESKDATDALNSYLLQYIKPRQVALFCSYRGEESMLDNGVTILYSYRTNDGVPLINFKITPTDCATPQVQSSTTEYKY